MKINPKELGINPTQNVRPSQLSERGYKGNTFAEDMKQGALIKAKLRIQKKLR